MMVNLNEFDEVLLLCSIKSMQTEFFVRFSCDFVFAVSKMCSQNICHSRENC